MDRTSEKDKDREIIERDKQSDTVVGRSEGGERWGGRGKEIVREKDRGKERVVRGREKKERKREREGK